MRRNSTASCNRIAKDGPVGTADVGEGEVRGKGGWWDWHPSKTALEWLWRTGQLAITRRDGFRQDLRPDRTGDPASAPRSGAGRGGDVDWACRTALEHLGFAHRGEIAGLLERGQAEEAQGLVPARPCRGARSIEVEVEGAAGQRQARASRCRMCWTADGPPEPAPRLRILSPFDPALRDRDRAEFLFGFFYRIEVFVPEPKRHYGYYVFPVLEGDRLVGRIDVKAFRDAGALRVKAFWPEAGVKLAKGGGEAGGGAGPAGGLRGL